MKPKSITLLFFLSIVLFFPVSRAFSAGKDTTDIQEKKPLRVYYTTRLTTAKPVIDGVLNDPCWKTGTWTGDFIQWIPKEGAAPSQKTELKILYDDKNLYVAIRAFDNEPGKISRKGGRRDEFVGDIVGVNFDSYHDHRTGFEFSVTAAGQKIDLILTNPMEADMNWNAVWYVKTGLEDSAWVAEYEIPLSQLRYSSEKDQVWGLHVWRWIDRLSEESDWEPQTLTGPGVLYAFGELKGISDLPKSQRIEIMPYVLGKLNTFEKVPQNPFAKNGRSWFGNAGLDAKIGISSNFTADLTVNPDFGQVESDPSVMNLTAFETFYEEKRPFFLEGSNIFKFEIGDNNLFYSRRIGHAPTYQRELKAGEYLNSPDNTAILSAVKISGKSANGLAVGVLQSLTASEKADFYSEGNKSKLQVEPLTSYTVARVQQDFNQGTTMLGGIVTATNRFINNPDLEFLNRNAFSGGLDFLTQWNEKEFFFDAKLIGSSVGGSADAMRILQLSSARYYQRPDGGHTTFDPTLTRLSGQGGELQIGKGSKGLWRYSVAFNWKSPGLELNDLGFMQMADLVNEETEISYFVNKPVSIFRTYTVGVHQNNFWDYRMNYINSAVYAFASMDFLNRWTLAPSLHYQNQTNDNRILRGGPTMLLPARWEGTLSFHTDYSKKIFGSVTGSQGAAGDHSARNSMVDLSATAIPFNVLKFSVSLNYSKNMDDLQYVNTTSFADGSMKYTLAHLNQKTLGLTFRVDYNISPELSLQYYGSPFASVGKYTSFKEVTNPKALAYKDRFNILNTQLQKGTYTVNGNTSYSFTNPDFTFDQFRSNLVFRWEYRPGSQLFLVWSNDRTAGKNEYNPNVADAMGQLRHVFPNNIFLIKVNYWFSM